MSLPTPSAAEQDAVKLQIRQQLQAQQLENLVQTLADKSFAKCVHKPSSTLSTSEQHCIAKAMDRYLEAMTIVFQTLNRKASS